MKSEKFVMLLFVLVCGTGLFSANAQSPVVNNPFALTTLAEYKLGGLTGPTVPDSSGNGYDGVLGSGSNAPAEEPYGLVFNGPFGTAENYAAAVQWFNVPAAIPQYGSFVANICYDPGPSTWFPQLPPSTGDLLGADWLQPATGHQLWADGPNSVSINAGFGSVANGSFQSAEASFQGGCGVFVYTLDTVDRFYWNGVEVQYTEQGFATAAKPTNGYTVGGTPNGLNRGFTGIMTHVMFLSNVVAPADVPALVAYSNSIISGYAGLPQAGATTSTTDSQIIGVGDSLMCGWNLTACSISPFVYIAPNTNYVFNNYGVGKQFCQDLAAFASIKQNQAYSPDSGSIITAVLCGTNNVDSSSETVQTIFNSEMALVNQIKQNYPAGRVLLFTKYSSVSAADDARIEALAALERAGAYQYGYDLFDAQAIPQLGAAGAYAGPCFADLVHPTQACIENYVSPALTNKINQMDGATQASPTIYTPNTVSMVSADNFVIAVPTSTAEYTLPDCLGLTGVVYQISNDSAEDNTITFSGLAGESIAGGATLAQNATARFEATLASQTTGGCGWQRTQ